MPFKLLCLVFLLVLGHSSVMQAQQDTYARISIPEEFIESLNEIVQADHAYKKDNRIVLEESVRVLDRLRNAGIPFDVLIPDMTAYYQAQNKRTTSRSRTDNCPNTLTRTPRNFKLGSMGGYLNLEEMKMELMKMHNQFPNLITNPAPISDFQTYENRTLLYVRITAGNTINDKKGVLYTALHHAREPLSMQQLIYYMWYLLENYGKDPLVTNLLDQTNLYFIPCVNPDGYAYNALVAPEGGGNWRKNRRPLGGERYGVDLNRNYGYEWGYSDSGSSDDPESETYRGPEAFSEPETRAVKWFCENHEIYAALNYHSHGDFLIYPWGYKKAPTKDDAGFKALAQTISLEKRIRHGTSEETVLYTTNGDTDDWMYGETNTKNRIFSFTPEVGPVLFGFYPPEDKIEMLCERELDQNIRLALAPHHFAHVVHANEPMVNSRSFKHHFYLYPLSMEEAAVQSEIIPISQNVRKADASLYIVGLKDKEEHSINIELKPEIQAGEKVIFALKMDNGTIVRTDTITYIYNPSAESIDLLNESNDIQAWIRSSESNNTWGITTSEYYSPPSSINDSPLGRYTPGTENAMYSKHAILIPDEDAVYLTFRTRWDITHSKDYAQLSVSTDGSHYVPLCGRWTTERFDYQGHVSPVYTGFQDEWFVETISLAEYAGEEVFFKWNMVSESTDGKEGIYIDDMRIVFSSVATSAGQNLTAWEGHQIYPNPVSGDRLRLRLLGSNPEQVYSRYEIRNILGNKMGDGRIRDTENVIPVTGFPAGIYMIQLYRHSGLPVQAQKFIIAR